MLKGLPEVLRHARPSSQRLPVPPRWHQLIARQREVQNGGLIALVALRRIGIGPASHRARSSRRKQQRGQGLARRQSPRRRPRLPSGRLPCQPRPRGCHRSPAMARPFPSNVPAQRVLAVFSRLAKLSELGDPIPCKRRGDKPATRTTILTTAQLASSQSTSAIGARSCGMNSQGASPWDRNPSRHNVHSQSCLTDRFNMYRLSAVVN
jgi:hypothetical protein